TATAAGAGPIALTSTTGAITIAGVSSSGSGAITLIAEDININAELSSSGALILEPITASTSIGLAGAAGSFTLSAADIANLTDGFSSIQIGRANGTGGITTNAVTFTDPTSLLTPLGSIITVNGRITGSGNASITLDGVGATTYLAADIVTAGNAITISDSVVLQANVLLDTTNAGGSPAGAAISVTGVIDADLAASARTLTLTAGTAGAITLSQAVGGGQALQTLTVTGA